MSGSLKRVGLIGLSAKGSWASRSHLAYLQNSTDYTITALQNSSEASAEAAAKKYSLSSVNTHSSPESIASDPTVDIIAISVNVPEHYALTRPAIEAGKDVFVEWPLARNATDARELLSLAQKKGIRTMIGLQARQSPSIIKAKQYVESGKLGKILSTNLSGYGSIFGPAVPSAFAYGLPIEAGANLVTIPFGHAIDALCFVLGELESLTATLGNLRPEIKLLGAEGEEAKLVSKTAHDQVSVSGTLVNGGGVVTAAYSGGSNRTGRDFVWEINGTEGTLLLESQEGVPAGGHAQMYQPTIKFFSNEPGSKAELLEVEKAGDFEKGDFSYGVGKAWDAWAGKGLEGGASVTTFEDAVKRHEMIEAIYKSAKNGTREKY